MNKIKNISDALAHFEMNETMLLKVVNEAMDNGAEYADLYFQHSQSSSIALRDNQVDRASSNIDFGVGIRAVIGEQTGYAYVESTNLEDMLHAARTAAKIANQLRQTKPIHIHELQGKNYYKTEHPWVDISIEKKKQYIEKLDKRIFELDKRVEKTNILLSDNTTCILFFNSDGILYWDYKPLSVLHALCIMSKDGKIENGSSSRSYRMGFDFLTEDLIDTIAKEAVAQCSLMFDAVKPKGGEMPVVMGAGSSGILLHEAIGHSFEADFNRKKTSIFSDQLGEKICSEHINVVDDGTIVNSRGSINFDDEGVESQKTYIVKDGVLESYLHDRISAKHYGIAPTGNGRRQSFRYAPMPRMRVTYMESGQEKEEDIIASVKKGVYVDNFTNGQVQIGAGDFTFFVKSGYLIENGKLTEPIKDINIIGNGPQALADISMVGNNLKIDEGAWTCGKSGQSVPVGQGLPSVLVKKLTVGGV